MPRERENAPKVTKRFSRGSIVHFATPSVRPSDGCNRRLRLRLCGAAAAVVNCAQDGRGRRNGPHKKRNCGDGCNARRSWSSAEHEGKEPQIATAIIRPGFVKLEGDVALCRNERNDLPPPPQSAYLLLPVSLSTHCSCRGGRDDVDVVRSFLARSPARPPACACPIKKSRP